VPLYSNSPSFFWILANFPEIRWCALQGDRVVRDENNSIVATGASTDLLRAQWFSNFIRRQGPYVLGFFPFIAWVVVLIVHLETAKADLVEGTNGSLQIPDFVNTLLCTQLLYPTPHFLPLSAHILCIVFSDGTVVIYSSFSFVMVCDQNPELANAPCYDTTSYMCCCSIRKKQPIFQALPPGYYFGSEICCTLQIHASCTT
jgi:hypothetical protein